MCVGPSAAQETFCLQTQKVFKGRGKTIPARDIEHTQNGTIVTYRFNNVILQDDPLYDSATIVKIEGFWPNCNVSEPAFLSRWDTFVVPNADAKVVVRDSSYIEIPMELSPARPLLSNSEDEPYTKDNVIPIGSYHGFFPSNVIPGIRNDSYRGQQLLDVCVAPVQYDYVNRRVRVFTMIKYELQYNVASLEKSLSKISRERKRGNAFLDNIALNLLSKDPSQTPKAESSSIENTSSKYLIVSVPKYATAVNKFAEWKRTLGFNVQIEMRESWDTITVKNVVHSAYEADSIEYLLIVGGHDDVPAITRNMYFNNKEHVTDLYYGCMSDGYVPDIHRGRIPVTSNTQALIVVDKIISYEKNPVEDERFYKTGVHCAYFQDSYPRDSFEDRRFVLTSERVRESMLRDSVFCTVDSIVRIYYTDNNVCPTYWNNDIYAHGEEIPAELQKPAYTWDGNSTNISNCINQKAFYVLMRDHGERYKWKEPSYSVTNIAELHNGDSLPVVFSICCHTGEFDALSCFCEYFLKKSDGGCVAIYGASGTSLSGANDVLTEGMFDVIWPSLNLHPVFDSISISSYSPIPAPSYRLGQILDQGLKRCDEAYLGSYKAHYPQYTSEVFHCFGDPAMMIYTEKPRPFTNATVNRLENGMISVNTGGVFATISFYNKRTGEVWSCVGYSVSHIGDFDTSVCISAHNMIPLIIEVNDMLYIQNQTLADGGRYEAKTIKVGRSVTTSQPQGDVIFSQGDYHLIGNRVELHPGTKVTHGATMKISNR